MVQKKSLKAGRDYDDDIDADIEFFCFSSGKKQLASFIKHEGVLYARQFFRPEIENL